MHAHLKHLTPSRLRFLIQTGFTLFCLYAGYRFHFFCLWATGQSSTMVAKPGAVEGFLPISALLGLKQLLLTGVYDPVHPAGLTIFLAVLAMALLFRKGFCGYVCPVGFLSSLLEKTGRALGLTRVLPRKVEYGLRSIKYVLLGFFLYFIGIGMSLPAVRAFLTSPYNLTADARMLDFFLHPSPLALVILAGLGVAALVIPYAWCRFLCPYGGLLGLLALLGPVAVHRKHESCTGCGKCEAVCPGAFRIRKAARINSPECVGCLQCVQTCPVKDALAPRYAGGNRIIPWPAIGIGAVTVLLLFYGVARLTGHWDPSFPPDMLKRFYSMFPSMPG
jgi:polyferredoxin